MALIALALAATILGGETPAGASAEAIASIRRVMDDQLNDYLTARFRNVRLVSRPSNTYVTLAVCGEVNSRGASGGYSGWTKFTILNDRMEEAERSSIGRRGWAVWCDGADVVVLDPDITEAVSPPAP